MVIMFALIDFKYTKRELSKFTKAVRRCIFSSKFDFCLVDKTKSGHFCLADKTKSSTFCSVHRTKITFKEN